MEDELSQMNLRLAGEAMRNFRKERELQHERREIEAEIEIREGVRRPGEVNMDIGKKR